MEENLGHFYKSNPFSNSKFLLGRSSLSISTSRGKMPELKEFNPRKKEILRIRDLPQVI